MSPPESPLLPLSRFAETLTFESLPAAVIESIKFRVLDTLGLCLAASRLETSISLQQTVLAWAGAGKANAIGTPQKLPAANAALINGVLAHSLDFDDTHLPSVLHPSASIIPGVIAVGQELNANPRQVIAAAAVGYEICVRTGMAAYDRELKNSLFFERGWHATSICGTLGVAAAAAKLYGLNAAGIGHAIGIAASMGAGIIEANRAGGSVKKLHCGWAAHSGIIAAQLAQAGFTGPASVFEGRFGFYQAFCGGNADLEELTAGLGQMWCIPNIFYKPYPANHFTHAGIDAALKMRNQISLDQIARIELGVATPTLRTIGEPREAKIKPQSGYHAQFSGPFTIAAALIGGGGLGLWLDDFTDDKAQEPAYLELAAKVFCFADPDCDAIFPNQFPCVLRVHKTSGEVIQERIRANRGGPERPLSFEELKIKFSLNAGRALDAARAEHIATLVNDLEKQSLDEVLTLTIAQEGEKQ